MEKIIFEGNSDRKLYIMRGLPGSGKSTQAHQIGGLIYSTDDFFIKDGIYQFDSSKLTQAHQWNQQRTKEALDDKIHTVVVDNTGIKAWEMRPYAEFGFNNDYMIILAEPETPHKWDVSKLAQINSHNVPERIIQRMKDNYQHNLSLDDILKA